MAEGLRAINKGYIPWGNGRDWFFVGDRSFRYGGRTPLPQDRKQFEQDQIEAHWQWRSGEAKKAELAAIGATPEKRWRETKRTVTAVERWQSAHDAPINRKTERLDLWKKNQKVVMRGTPDAGAYLPRICSAPSSINPDFTAVSQDLGRFHELGESETVTKRDKYNFFSVPINDPARFSFMNTW